MAELDRRDGAALAAGAPAVSAMPWALVAASVLGMFAITASGSTRSPFLVDMAADLSVSLPAVANLFGLTSIAWGASSFFAGTASDRLGRRIFLVGGPIALALALAGVASADGYFAVAAWVALAGGCSGLYTGVNMAEVANRVSDRQRGRALGWVMSGQSLTLLVGVPLAAWIGASIGWRGVHLCIAVLALVAAVAMFATIERRPRDAAGEVIRTARPPSLRAALSPMVIKLLAAVVADRICFGLAAVYYATFLLTTYNLTVDVLVLPLFLFALGNILGTVLGGQLGDLIADRLLTFAAATICSGVVALVLFAWHPSLTVSVALGFAYVFFNALARPALMAALANVPAEVQGTVMGLNSTCASVGWLSAAAFGGWMLATVGFAGFGPLVAVLALLGAAVARFGPRLTRPV